MSCSPFDLRDYFLKELAEEQRREVEAHAKVCPQCQEELDRLRLTEAALFTLRDEEIPQRIAFVSDKVFEPSPWRRWLAAFWGSTARLGFVSAAMLSVALIVFAATRPASTNAEIERRVQAAALQAAQAIEARYAAKTEQLVKAIRQRDMDERKMMMASYDVQATYLQHKLTASQLDNLKLINAVNSPGDMQ
ncbi:putative transmembrane anti-sigma factor [Candidatus Sulfopaludibacter sp. SbA3]|nr:putative transmembrane anti-sigma factor [Candidatus Sulfopaludibacter sp. SbA3]